MLPKYFKLDTPHTYLLDENLFDRIAQERSSFIGVDQWMAKGLHNSPDIQYNNQI